MNGCRSLCIAISIGFLTSCGFNSTDPVHVSAAGGVAGAAAGAGTGAIIGSMISSGDVAASALLGTAIGLPVGALAGYYWVATENEREIATLDDTIERNAQEIELNELRLMEQRRRANDASFVIYPDSTTREELYTGPTLGDPTR